MSDKSKTTTTISFRCPSDILEAIDAIGRKHYPKDKNSKTGSECDRTKTLFHIIQAGIAALTDGDIQIAVRQPSKTDSNTGINQQELEDFVKKLISDNQVIQSGNTDNVRQYENIDIVNTIQTEIKSSLDNGGLIGEAIANAYENMMGNLNQLVNDIAFLKSQLSTITNNQSPISDLQIDDLRSENQILKSWLEYEGYDEIDFEKLPLNRSQVIKFFDIQDILDGAEYSDPILRERGIKSKMDGDIDHFGKFIDLSKTHHTDVMERFNRILNWLGYDCEKLYCRSSADGGDVWRVICQQSASANNQSPITPTVPTVDNVDNLEVSQESGVSSQESGESPITDHQLPTSHQEIIDLLGINEIITNKGKTNFKIYIEYVNENNINENIRKHQETIEKSLNIKLSLEDKLTDLKAILKAMNYELKESRNQAKNMVNTVACDVKSSSHFILL